MIPLSRAAARLQPEIVGPPRNPRRLYEAWKKREVTEPSDLAHLISDIWTRDDSDSPEAGLAQACWIELFQASGFFVLPTNAPMPSGELTVYRAAPEDQVRRMAWTLSLQMAEHFRRGKEQRGIPAHVYQAQLPEGAALAYLQTRREFEVIVDPGSLQDIRPV